MKSYIVTLTCRECGGPLEHVNATVRSTEAVGVTRCWPCQRDWFVAIQLRPVPGYPSAADRKHANGRP